MAVNGQQRCNDTGNRMQDFPAKTMEQFRAAGPKAVPVLIGMLTDDRTAKTREPIICYRGEMTIGDIAFCPLSDRFTNRKQTVPSTDWNDLLGPGDHLPAVDPLHIFIEKHGIAALPLKWRRLWEKHSGHVFWDSKERCFEWRAGK
ncbi:MAG: hypothetical protein ABSF59_20690 [Candidatus Sulfotelmatobacter sp.]|jgi:hypothetical protein